MVTKEKWREYHSKKDPEKVKEWNRNACKKYRDKDPEKRRAYQREWYHKNKRTKNYNKEKACEAVVKWREKHPEKHKAQCHLRSAVKGGKITKPGTCEMCGISTKVEAHHFDYNLYYHIVWVCRKCHGFLDRARKKCVDRRV